MGWDHIGTEGDPLEAFVEGYSHGGGCNVIAMRKTSGNVPRSGRAGVLGDVRQGSLGMPRSPRVDAEMRARTMAYVISTPPPRPPNGTSDDANARGNGISEYEGCEGRVDAIEGVTIDIRNAATEMNDEIRDGLRRINDRLDEVEDKSITQRAEMIDVERNVQRRLDDSIRDLRSWIREELAKAVESLGRERGEASKGVNHVERDEFTGIAKSVELMSFRVRYVVDELKRMKGTMDLSMSRNIAEPLQQIRESINVMTGDVGTVKGRVDAMEKLTEKIGKEHAEIMDENKQLRDRLRVVECNIARSADIDLTTLALTMGRGAHVSGSLGG